MNYEQKTQEQVVEHNKYLVEKYPFLYPRNVWSGKKDEDYDYTYTELDGWPPGWVDCFGELFCEDMKAQMDKEGGYEDYYPVQVKEKYGQACWYDNGSSEEIQDIIGKYSHVSEHVCEHCGKFPVPLIDDGWVMAVCPECFTKHMRRRWSSWRDKTDEEILEFYNKYIVEKDFDKYYRYTRWTKDDGESKVAIDCSDITDRILERNDEGSSS